MTISEQMIRAASKEAHAPTDDEREALATRWLSNYHGSIDATALVLAFKAGLAAGFRRTMQDAPTDDEREALARIIDPEAWRDVQPHSTAFYDDEEAQKRYEGFFWEGVQERRAPSLAAADRVLGFRRTVQGGPSDHKDRMRAALRAAAAVEGGEGR
ncbi:hypothetical protein ABE10_06160 [Bacillus toyonensis]|nr:hypothetical protein [Bacillus toyonensis]